MRGSNSNIRRDAGDVVVTTPRETPRVATGRRPGIEPIATLRDPLSPFLHVCPLTREEVRWLTQVVDLCYAMRWTPRLELWGDTPMFIVETGGQQSPPFGDVAGLFRWVAGICWEGCVETWEAAGRRWSWKQFYSALGDAPPFAGK